MLRTVRQGWLSERKEDCQKWGRQQDSPKWNENAQRNGAEEGSPPRDLRRTMQDVGADHEAFKNDDEAVEPEDQAETPFIVPAKRYGEYGKDESDHTAKGGDDLEETTQDSPERGEGDADQLQPNQPEDGYDESVQRGGSPPVDQSTTCRFE